MKIDHEPAVLCVKLGESWIGQCLGEDVVDTTEVLVQQLPRP
jgi:hypothetical protein